MNYIINFFIQHPYIAASISTWWSNFFISAFCNSLPAPTKDSSQFYKFCFKFATYWLAQNPSRANGTRIEGSPNFNDALQKMADLNGGKIPNGVVKDAKKNPLSLT